MEDHQWQERREPHLRIESGEAVMQHHCGRCGRDIVTVVSSGARHAVYASVLCFYRLDEEVTQRWLGEPCPGVRLTSDDRDRKSRLVETRVAGSDRVIGESVPLNISARPRARAS
jgi:hypothetical protein